MKLTAQQIDAFDRDGFLVLPNLLDADEIELLRSELARVSHVVDERIMRERGSDAARIIYGLPDIDGPTFSSAYYNLARDHRILQPVIDMLEEGTSRSSTSNAISRKRSTAAIGSGTRTTPTGRPTMPRRNRAC